MSRNVYDGFSKIKSLKIELNENNVFYDDQKHTENNIENIFKKRFTFSSLDIKYNYNTLCAINVNLF